MVTRARAPIIMLPDYIHVCLRLYPNSQGGESVTLLEIIGKNGAVHVNGKAYFRDSTIPLNGGDEVVFSSSNKHAYVSYHNIILFYFCGVVIVVFLSYCSCWLAEHSNYCTCLFPSHITRFSNFLTTLVN